MLDTDDLVQDTVFQTLKRLQSFEVRHEGALQGYLRTAVVNRIRDEVRRATRHPGRRACTRTVTSTPPRRRSKRRSAARPSRATSGRWTS